MEPKINGVTPSAETEVKSEDPQPSFTISRFKTFAGKNRELLQQLIAGSIKAVEEYRNDFLEVQNEEDLSDLIHKNTTNIHYISAARLTGKIEGFKNILTDPTVGEEEQEKKKRAILEEFDRISKGIKDLK